MDLKPEMFVDLDLSENCVKKAMILRNRPELSSIIFEGMEYNKYDNSPSIFTDHYILQPQDLTKLDDLKEFIQKGLISTELPTLFLAECVLIYINPDLVNPTLQYLQQTFKSNIMVIYEQIRPNDPFGKMMLRNLHERGCDLLALTRYPEIEDQKKRYLDFGYSNVFCEDMYTVYNKLIDQQDVRRISRIELFDEFEEWHLIQSHYCLLVAAQGDINNWFSDLVSNA